MPAASSVECSGATNLSPEAATTRVGTPMAPRSPCTSIPSVKAICSAVPGAGCAANPQADYYLLKWILHDWSDEDCVRILRNCRAAGGRGARVLIVEALVGEVGEPDPVALFDMNMLAVTSGRQRSLEELDTIFAASGWLRVGLSSTRTVDSLLELEAD
jgi:hypothetical protein